MPRHLPRKVVRACAEGSCTTRLASSGRVGSDSRRSPARSAPRRGREGCVGDTSKIDSLTWSGVCGDLLLRQADVEALRDAPAALLRDDEQALRERELVVRRIRSPPPRRDRPRPATAPHSIPRRGGAKSTAGSNTLLDHDESVSRENAPLPPRRDGRASGSPTPRPAPGHRHRRRAAVAAAATSWGDR